MNLDVSARILAAQNRESSNRTIFEDQIFTGLQTAAVLRLLWTKLVYNYLLL